MCNLYSSYTTQEAMRRAFEVARDNAGNVPPLPAIFPDQMAPVVRTVNSERELIQMRWGFPPPPKVGTQPVTNVRNVASPFWRAWLKPQYRCLVPLTSFSEYKDTKPRKTPVWLALNKDRPLAAFAGIWRPWTGVRGAGRQRDREAAIAIQHRRARAVSVLRADLVVGNTLRVDRNSLMARHLQGRCVEGRRSLLQDLDPELGIHQGEPLVGSI